MILQKIRIDDIFIDENRKEGGYGDVTSLAESIKEFGQITPISVVELDCEHPHYRVLAGRRRIAAFKSLSETDSQYEELQACVYAIDEVVSAGIDEEGIALAENTAREAMHPLDEGHVFARLLRGGKSAEEVGAIFCRSRSQVYQRAKLDDLLPELKEAYKSGFITLTQAARFASVAAAAQEKIIEGMLLYKTQSNLFPWQVNELLRKALPLKIGKNFHCDACMACTKRTRFDDATLFEELETNENYCLDDQCYNKHWLEQIVGDIASCKERAEASGVEVENVIVRDSQMLPGEAGGKLLVDGEEYTVLQNKDVCFVFGMQKEKYKDNLHTGIKVCFNGSMDLGTYVSLEDKKRHDAKTRESFKLKKDETADAVLSALPTPVRKQAIEKAAGGALVKKETIYRVAGKMLIQLAGSGDYIGKTQVVLFASRLAEDLRGAPDAFMVVFTELARIEDVSYEALCKMSKEELMSLQAVYDILESVCFLNPFNIMQNEHEMIFKRLKEAGIPFDFQKFVDSCVIEQYQDLLAEHAKAAMPVEPDAWTDDETPVDNDVPRNDYAEIEDIDDEKN